MDTSIVSVMTLLARKWNRILAVLPLLLACLLLLLPMGCQEQTAKTSAPAVAQQSQGGVAQPQAAQPQSVQPQAVQPTVPEVRQPAPPAAGTSAISPGVRVMGPMPQISLENLTLDLGNIGTGTAVKGQFRFVNKGQVPLKITNVGSCCGVVTKLSKEDFQPGESGTLDVNFTAGGDPTISTRQLTMSSNDPINPTINLNIKANIVRRITFTPESLQLFLNRPNAGCRDIVLSSEDGKPFAIKTFRVSNDAMTVQFDPNTKATKFTLTPKVDIAKIEKITRGLVSIETTHPESPGIAIWYDVLPEFTVSPPQIYFLHMKPGEPQTPKDIWFWNNYSNDFEVESVSTETGLLRILDHQKVAFQQPGAQKTRIQYQIKVGITPPEKKGADPMLTDVLIITLKGGTKLSVRCSGFYE